MKINIRLSKETSKRNLEGAGSDVILIARAGIQVQNYITTLLPKNDHLQDISILMQNVNLSGKSRIPRQHWYSVLLLILACLVFFLPTLLENKTFYAFDTLFQYLPWAPYASPGMHINNTLITDPVNYFYIFREIFKQSIVHGQFPLWFSSICCGMPFQPNGSPLSYVLAPLFSVTAVHDALLFLHLFLAGIFTYAFLINRRLRPGSAVIGALAWMFNGYLMVWFEFEQLTMIAAALPATLLCIEFLRRHFSWPTFFALAFSISYTTCTAHIQMLIYQLLFVEAYLLLRLLPRPRSGRTGWTGATRSLLQINAAVVTGIIMSAGIIAIYLDSYFGSQRLAFSFSNLFKETGQLPGRYLLTLIFPNFFGGPGQDIALTPLTALPQPYNNYNELCIYAGVSVLLLASVCLCTWRKNRLVKFFLGTALLTLLMALGTYMYYPLARFVPGLNLSTPTRVLYIFGFSIAMLGGFGADYLWRVHSRRRFRLLIPAFVILLLSIAVAITVHFPAGLKWLAPNIHAALQAPAAQPIIAKHFSLLGPALLQPIVIAFTTVILLLTLLSSKTAQQRKRLWFLLVVLIAVELINFGQSYNTAAPRSMAYPLTDAIRFLQKDTTSFRVATLGDRFMLNSLAPFGIEDVGGYASVYPRRYGEYVHLCHYGLQTPPPEHLNRWLHFQVYESPLLDLANVKYVCAPPKAQLPSAQLQLVYDGEVRIFQNTRCFPRAFFVPQGQLVATPQQAYQTIESFTDENFHRTVVLEQSDTAEIPGPQNPQNTDSADAEIVLIQRTANSCTVKANCPTSGYLVISNNYHPGWKALVDGRGTAVLRANYIMQAIRLEAGQHTIQLIFRPRLIINGLLFSAACWIGVIAYLFWSLTLKAIRNHTMVRQ